MNTSTRSRFLSAVLSIAFVVLPAIALASHLVPNPPAMVCMMYGECPDGTAMRNACGDYKKECLGHEKPGVKTPSVTTDLQSRIQSLLAQIKVLQERIRGLTSSDNQSTPINLLQPGIESGDAGTSNEIEIEKRNIAEREQYRDYSNRNATYQGFTRNLSVGSRGDDVLQLQQILVANGYLQPSATTGYFGTQTRTALGLWQLAQGIAQVGTFGPKSREFLKNYYYNSDGTIPTSVGNWGTVIPDKPPQYFCTQDAVQCPDGSYVGRTGPKCEAVCPTTPTKCTPRPACMDTEPFCEIDPPNVCPPATPKPSTCNPACGIGYKCTPNCGSPVGYAGEPHPGYSCFPANQERFCPICLAGKTLIDTPSGTIQVKDMKVGMAIWTTDKDGNRIEGVVTKISKVPVPPTHKMVHLILNDGRDLFVSPGHPTADGRTVGVLAQGERYDGAVITSTQRVSYSEGATYDVLPSGSTGFYWANGVLLGSTLK